MSEQHPDEVKVTLAKPEPWWRSWIKGISVFAIAGGLASFAVNFATEWYMERKSEEYERMTRMEESLEEVNKQLAVMNQEQQNERADREALWKVMQHTNADVTDLKVKQQINAHVAERNYRDIKDAHGGKCSHKKDEHEKDLKDLKDLTELQKMWKRAMGTEAEKKALAEEEAKKAEEARTKELLEKAKEAEKHKTLEQFKEQHQLPNAPPREYEQRKKK
jgi:hypothetical protein